MIRNTVCGQTKVSEWKGSKVHTHTYREASSQKGEFLLNSEAVKGQQQHIQVGDILQDVTQTTLNTSLEEKVSTRERNNILKSVEEQCEHDTEKFLFL